jgi:formylglycine-generating enzyme required for sulfatase activity
MSGNVCEWCSDNHLYADSVTSGTDRYYFQDDSTSQYFLQRGGAWYNLYGSYEYNFRCAYRYGYSPGYRDNYIGFRVARP